MGVRQHETDREKYLYIVEGDQRGGGNERSRGGGYPSRRREVGMGTRRKRVDGCLTPILVHARGRVVAEKKIPAENNKPNFPRQMGTEFPSGKDVR